jgi:hypothetical protein
MAMAGIRQGRLLEERALDAPIDKAARRRPARSVTVNCAESPLGWLKARGLVSQRQYDAGERLRLDWERAQLSPKVTMTWDAAPVARGRSGSAPAIEPAAIQIDAHRRFHAAIDAAGPGLSDILWRVVCSGDGMRQAETALGWPARAGKLVLLIALDRIANHYRIG